MRFQINYEISPHVDTKNLFIFFAFYANADKFLSIWNLLHAHQLYTSMIYLIWSIYFDLK